MQPRMCTGIHAQVKIPASFHLRQYAQYAHTRTQSQPKTAHKNPAGPFMRCNSHAIVVMLVYAFQYNT